MRSAIDIILARQRATLQLSIAELRRVLDEDDNWRALAALDSVCEAAGGVSGQGWIARRQELTGALATNPIYCLCNELERALAIVSHSIGDVQSPEDQGDSIQGGDRYVGSRDELDPTYVTSPSRIEVPGPEDVADGDELPGPAQQPIHSQREEVAADLPRDVTVVQSVVTQRKRVTKELARDAVRAWEGEGGALIDAAPRANAG